MRYSELVPLTRPRSLKTDLKGDKANPKGNEVVVFYRPKWEEGEGLEEGGQKGWPEKVARKLRLNRL